MRKLIPFLALAAALFSACSEDNYTDEPPQEEAESYYIRDISYNEPYSYVFSRYDNMETKASNFGTLPLVFRSAFPKQYRYKFVLDDDYKELDLLVEKGAKFNIPESLSNSHLKLKRDMDFTFNLTHYSDKEIALGFPEISLPAGHRFQDNVIIKIHIMTVPFSARCEGTDSGESIYVTGYWTSEVLEGVEGTYTYSITKIEDIMSEE